MPRNVFVDADGLTNSAFDHSDQVCCSLLIHNLEPASHPASNARNRARMRWRGVMV